MSNRPDIVVLKNVRLSFAQLFKPTASMEGGPLKYRANFIIDPTTAEGKVALKEVQAAINHAAKEKFGEKWEKILANISADRVCMRDGDKNVNKEGETYQGYEGMQYVAATNSKRPQTLDRDKSPVTEDDDVLYSGAYVDGVVSIYATNEKKFGGNGIFATLQIVRKRKDGDSFGSGSVNADDVLDDLEDDDDMI